MYISDKFVYTELHKTAGTHIGKWLNILATGQQMGKHNIIPKELRNRIVLGSIRNPWDWYVSLWGYGCDHKGSVYYQTTNGVNFRYYHEQLTSEMGMTHLKPSVFINQLIADIKKTRNQWEKSYSDSSDPECFKSWLRLMFSKKHKFEMREGFGFSPVSDDAGIMTYRFLKFFTDLEYHLYDKDLLSSHSNLFDLWESHKIADFFIRMEHLEEDLIAAMNLAGVHISEENKNNLLSSKNKKTNTSSRLDTNFYYDEESIKLVGDRDNLIIQLFNYLPPNKTKSC